MDLGYEFLNFHGLALFAEWLKLEIMPFWKTLSCFLFIFFISAIPGQRIPDVAIWNFDKLVHGSVYFGLVLFAYLDIKKAGSGFWARHALGLAFIGSVAYGGLLEILQNLVFVNRSGNWIDFWANAIGALCAVAMIYLHHHFVRSTVFVKE